MDTKLKNSNKALRIGIIITILAAAAFTALFPEFKLRANELTTFYKNDFGVTSLEDEEFIRILLQSNYALYKNVMHQADNSSSYEDLYITKTLDDISDSQTQGGALIDNVEREEVLNMYDDYLQTASAASERWFQRVGTYMDYYALEKSTGASVKNTSLAIEDLLLPGSDDDPDKAAKYDAVSAHYPYYVIMDYNEYGYLQTIKVKGTNADQLLKTVRAAETSVYGRLIPDLDETALYLIYDENIGDITKLLTVSQKKPANVTYIYAVTDAEMSRAEPTYYYGYWGAVDNVYSFFLLAILAVTTLLALCRPSMLTGKHQRTVPLEIVLLAGIVLWAVGMDLIVNFVMFATGGELQDWLDSFPSMHGHWGWQDTVIGSVLGFFLLALLFGLFYFCCLELSDITKGFRNYLQTRSLCWRIYRKVHNYFAETIRKIKADIANADLSDNLSKLLLRLVFINFAILAAASLLWFFGIAVLAIYSLALYLICKRYLCRVQTQYSQLLTAANSIAEGTLNNTFEDDFGVFNSYKETLCHIQDGFKRAVDEEVKSQKMKTELITNVSHDLKTPLTAIITYIGLLKEENITEEQKKEYIDTLESKSLRLKVLIEDLFEVSKANSGNVRLERIPVDIGNLLRQAYLEQEDKMERAGLQIRFSVPEEKVILYLDSNKTYRIFENLYTNIVKYALPATRVFVTLDINTATGGVRIELKNISAREITGDPQDLTERFVRGDTSRNTEGSGLGLAIARSFTEIQGGIFRIETDGDVFKAIIEWNSVIPSSS